MISSQSGWNRRQVLYLLSGAIGGLTLHACGRSTESAAPTTATTPALSASLGTVTWIGYTPIYIAQEKGFYQEQGLDLKIQVFNSGSEAIAAFAAGRTDGLSLVPSEAVQLAANGKDYRVIYVIDTSNGADGILARKSITSIADFKGKQIAVEKGGVSHFFLLQVMTEAGLKESDVSLVNLDPSAAAAAYQAGKVDVAVTYAPFLFTSNQAQSDGRIIYDSSKLSTPTAIADLLIFDTKFIGQNPQAIEAFIKGNVKALEFFNSNRQEGLEIASKQLGLKPAELDEQLKGVRLMDLPSNVKMLSDPASNLYMLKPLTAMVDFLKGQGQINKTPDVSGVLEPKFVKGI